MIWDDMQNRCVGELTHRTPVLSVKMRRDKIICVLIDRVFIYNFESMELETKIATTKNPLGICSVSVSASSACVVACLGLEVS
jgi:hypothetical protein